MIKYSIPQKSMSLISVNTDTFEIKKYDEEYVPTQYVCKITEDGEFNEIPVETGDYILMCHSYRRDKEFYTVIKKGTALHSFYEDIQEQSNNKKLDDSCCDDCCESAN